MQEEILEKMYLMPDPDDDGTTDPDEEETGGESGVTGGGN
jgi:hypothetical protein